MWKYKKLVECKCPLVVLERSTPGFFLIICKQVACFEVSTAEPTDLSLASSLVVVAGSPI